MDKPYFTITHKGMVRATNEDSFFARPPVFMVADGMGGAQAGEVASGIVAEAFSGFITPESGVEQELADLIKNINGRIHEIAESDADRAGMGTTVTAAVVSGGSVGIAHVGDSRAYMWRDGELKQLTKDHSLVGEMLRQGRISEAEAEVHPQRSIITRALGIEPGVDIDTASVEWRPGDVFLLCSDGLSSMVSDAKIADILGGAESMEAAAGSLVKAANTHGGRDNITAVLFVPELVSASGAGTSFEEADTGTMPAAASSVATGAAAEAPARISGTSGGQRSRLARCWRKIAIAAVIGLLLLGGAWLANSYIYYVGVEGDFIAVYRGVPLELGPLSFSSPQSVSDIRLDDLEPFEQERVQRHELRSRSGAEQVIDNYKGRLEEQRLEEERQATRTVTTSTSPAAAAPAAGAATTGSGA